ncbi:UDP-N-acetylmuramoyl-L-alanine--D-glutamate ligase [Spirosoma utsteinense]|uniref:UDP-N-acetylmuramoylalanine--D-glutamate ligase n=1 Tax=Spirosoma utsteinense TaxID=2585773 RepID=A0ABR6W8K6_9BACT|nr:UDP-N-acetylmuramoyl-L-alanine--D-glutamate ligase [Spirosoma utsteinense]MBC3786107.1 UDP-N-acetylmuramoylalanine--D-glutamate ligase [Spirosoma utsteinense]MBC3792296.1 UDP-N-acetylmuramoylalanine--D-glutamate ligase [Spirosoma utsteinense]
MAAAKLVILGGGESGVGAALLAKAKGYDVFLSDKSALTDAYRTRLQLAGIAFEEGQHTEERILMAAEVVKSPGIPGTVPLVQKLRAQGTPVISEIEFAARYTKAKLIGITGSNGKTTTTLLIYHLLKQAGLNVGLAGNVGDSFAAQVIDDTFDYFALELSSFQLDDMYETHLNVMVLLNITPDHLDRYGYNFQNYVNSKFRILQNAEPSDDFIYFAESRPIERELTRHNPAVHHLPISLETPVSEGGYLAGGLLQTKRRGKAFEIRQDETPLRGPHNAINMLAAVLAAQSVGVSNEALMEGLRTFENAAHRLEPAGTVAGIQFINDSKATNVDSVYYALSSMDAPVIWIAGGQDKGNDYSQLDELVGRKVKTLICLGIDNHKLLDYFGTKVPSIYETQTVQDAVAKGLTLGRPGDVVLLSPACASFDLFKNYEDRGNQFKAAVKNLLMSDE